jgi:hypothetical protein
MGSAAPGGGTQRAPRHRQRRDLGARLRKNALAVATSAVYHTIAPTRGKAVPTAFLGDAKPKVWLSDRLAAQGNHAEAHQYCLAHLIRDAQYAVEADRVRASLQGIPERCLCGRSTTT